MHKFIKIAGNSINTEDINVIEGDPASDSEFFIEMQDGTRLWVSKENSDEFFIWFKNIEEQNSSQFCPYCGGYNCDHGQEERQNFIQ